MGRHRSILDPIALFASLSLLIALRKNLKKPVKKAGVIGFGCLFIVISANPVSCYER